MRRNAGKLLTIGASLALLVASSAPVVDSAVAKKNPRAGKARLKSFHSCDALRSYGRRHRAAGKKVLPFTDQPSAVGSPDTAGEKDPGLGSADPQFSPTNVQEPGVDEPDIVKTDGSRIYALRGGQLHAIAVDGPAPLSLGSIPIGPRGGKRQLYSDDGVLLLYQGRALVFSGLPSGETLLTDVDVTDPAAMRVVATTKVEGSFVSARLNGATARVVISSSPQVRPLIPSAVSRNAITGRRAKGKLVACRSVRHPTRFSGLDLLTVLTIDMSRGLPAVDSDAITTSGDTVYGSTDSLYVATDHFTASGRGSTEIHKFALAPDATEYRGSGEVAGHMLSQWSMSERNGLLRVASTTEPPFGRSRGRSQSYVTVLADVGGRLGPIGRVGNLGLGEDIYAVRFIEDIAFVVTFRQIDPLYTIDLSAPTAPSVLGTLQVRGFSSYLHPIAPGLLLGIGQDATPEGAALGTQLSLFDVSDPRNPVRLHQQTISDASSEVENDPLAFLYWPPEQLAVLPIEINNKQTLDPSFAGAIGFHAGAAAGIQEIGRIIHGSGTDTPIRRTLVVGGRLYSVSDSGVMASNLKTLASEAWVPFY